MRYLFVALSLGLLVAGAMLLMARRAGPDWTTDSPEALAEFEQGLDAQMKYYGEEAWGHFKKAVELDDDFVAAKLWLYRSSRPGERKEELRKDLENADLGGLSPRERFLVSYELALADGDRERAERLLETYLDRHEGDPYALEACSRQAWDERDWERAERHYQKLLERDPNWVSAQNHLGYMAMSRGRFEEAERRFETYHYIAPDQANPHDSLGELLTALGRYEEAEAAFERALAIKPDFCASYEHLFSLYTVAGQPERYPELIERAEAHCGERRAKALSCLAGLWSDYLSRNFAAPFEEVREECQSIYRDNEFFLLHRMAVLTGRLDLAEEIEDQTRARLDQSEAWESDVLKAFYLHMKGVRLMAAGEFEEAATLLDKADRVLLYWGGHSILKMYNQMNLAYALERAGRGEESERVLAKVREVNPEFVKIYPYLGPEFERAADRAAA